MTRNIKQRILLTGLFTLLILAHLLWEYYHGGVKTHHVLQRADLPGISNWWGVVAMPLFTWLLIGRVQSRLSSSSSSFTFRNTAIKFCLAMLFGVTLSIFFSIGSKLPDYMMLTVIAASLFAPLYLAEYLLGFVVGMVFTFGALLPIAAGSILTLIFVINYRGIRSGVLYLLSKKG